MTSQKGASRARRALFVVSAAALLAVIAAAGVIGHLAQSRIPTFQEIESSASTQQAAGYRAQTERMDDYISLSYCVSAAAVVLLLGLTLVTAGRNPRVARWKAYLFAVDEPRTVVRALSAAAIGVAIALTLVMIVKANCASVEPDGEETSYLESAMHAESVYGTGGFAKALFTGDWSENHRHPLYIWAITPFAEPSPAFFVKAKLVSGVFAVASIFVVLFVAWRLFGLPVAAVTLLMYGLLRTFFVASSAITCDALLVSLVTLSIYFTVRGFEKGWKLILGGVFAALAYMTSLTGLFLPISFIMAALVMWRLGAFRRKYFYLYLAAFALAASPLLSRNVVRYHNPFSNVAFSNMWLESSEWKESMSSIEGTVSASGYFRKHSALDVALTIAEGTEEAVKSAGSAVSPFTMGPDAARAASRRYIKELWIGVALLAASFVFMLLDAESGRRAYCLALAAIVILSMGWYSRISLQPRALLPFAPLIFGYVSVGAVRLVGLWPYRALVLVAACVLGTATASSRLDIVHPYAVRMPDKDAVVLADWLDAHVKGSDVYLVGPDESLRLGWYRQQRGVDKPVPRTRDVETLVQASRRLKAKYVVISRAVYFARILQFTTAFDTPNSSLTVTRPIGGWAEVFRDPIPPVEYIVFEVLPAGKAETASGADNGK